MIVSLRHDLRRQKSALKTFAVTLAVFLGLLMVFDRLLNRFLVRGLERYYGLDRGAEILLIGHSHMVLGVDKEGLEQACGRSVAKYALDGADALCRLTMVRHYFDAQPDSVRVVVYCVDANLFAGKGLGSNLYQVFFPFMDAPSVDEYVRKGTKTLSEYLTRNVLLSSRFSETTVACSVRGWLGMWANLKRGVVDQERLRKMIARGDYRRIDFDQKKIDAFEQTLAEIRKRDIPVVLLFIPTIDMVNVIEPGLFAEALGRFQGYAGKDPGVIFLDYNPGLATRRDLFFDPIHLNPAGQQIVTQKLAADLGRTLKPLKKTDVGE